jgi:hypothetical protein
MALNDLLRPNATAQQLDDGTVHDWYRFVLSYPDHLVSGMLERFGVTKDHIVLDPFVGTGTTLVECKRKGIHSIGIDANPVTAFASQVKTTWDIDLTELDERFESLRWAVRGPLQSVGSQYATQLSFDDVLAPGNILAETAVVVDTAALKKLLPKNWISDTPLQKCLIIKDEIESGPQDEITDLFRLALADVLVAVSNLGFGPEVYVSKKRRDANVYSTFVDKVRRMRYDLHLVQQIEQPGLTEVYTGDARNLTQFVSGSVDFVICSPPYPNEKDYTRITRLELILLEFMQSKQDLRSVKKEMLRSHTRNVYVADNDAQYVADIPEIHTLSDQIEAKRIERGATSGFEKLYHRVVVEYFGGMYRVLEQLQQVMPVGGKLAFVVGDQMSYFRIPIRTAELLSLVACRKLAYRETERLLWRTRKATVTQMDIEEHILVLERC